MSETARKPHRGSPIYERDFARWAEEQGQKLRSRAAGEIDWDNVAEEIESLGRSDRYEIESRMEVLLLHLLKWRFQPEGRSNSWLATITEQRVRIARRIGESPSLKHYPADILGDAYRIAWPGAADEIGRPLEDLPETCPFAIGDALNPHFLPE
jgi:hypothetical protein